MNCLISTTYSYKIFGKRGNPVIFLFTGFKNKHWFHYLTIRKLIKAGYCVVVYDINASKVLEGEAVNFVNLAREIVESVKKQIESFKKNGAKNFFVFGMSMGTLFALRTSIDIPEIKKIVLNLTYGSLADNVWTWNKLHKLKKRFQKSGITKERLENILKPISPLSMAPELKGKKILLYLSKKDKVILFSQSLQFKEALDRLGVDYVYHQNNKFGHFASVLINNSRSKIYLNFLKGD